MTGQNTRRGLKSLMLAAFLLTVAAITGHAQEPRIGARPLTPQEIADMEELGLIPEGLHASGGLMTVGVGEPVYLEALVDMGTVVNSVSWSVVPPLALPASEAQIEESPLPDDLPLYSPGDRFVLELAGRAYLVPDVEGLYEVQAIVNTDSGAIVLNGVVAGAHYVGVGVLDGGAAQWPECARCHADKAFGGVDSDTGWIDTGHASFFVEAIDGIKSSHYSEGCVECHVLGGHAPENDNGGFYSVAREIGWTWPDVLQPGNWDALPNELKNKANIQCEHCHGAGSEHSGNPMGISVSYNAGDCGQCHDEEPYHNKNKEWLNSTHARVTDSPTGEGRGSCVRCHSAKGFAQTLAGWDEVSTDYEAISCAACHDPHNADNHGQLRTVADLTLQNGHEVTIGGAGKLCMNCHQSRRNAEDYVTGSVSSHFGPHYGVQGDMFSGTNAIDYGVVNGTPSAHAYAIENSCIGCHMQTIPSGDPARFEAGGHTFKPVWDNGTPEDHSDDVDMVFACVNCHGPIEDFNMERFDYNYDGVIEGVQTEVEHLLEALAMYLPPKGEPVYEYPGSSYPWTLAEKQALYNYLCVEEDGSHGIHNPRYMTQILRASINNLGDPFNAILGGTNVPAGGEWWYSKWFEFYAPRDQEGWIYHYEHGDLYVQAGDEDQVLLFDYRGGVWRYTTPDLYPLMYDVTNQTWVYYYGVIKGQRFFYKYDGTGWSAMY